jgi:hypothetical protein
MDKDLDYLPHLARESARFAAALHEVPPDARAASQTASPTALCIAEAAQLVLTACNV